MFKRKHSKCGFGIPLVAAPTGGLGTSLLWIKDTAFLISVHFSLSSFSSNQNDDDATDLSHVSGTVISTIH